MDVALRCRAYMIIGKEKSKWKCEGALYRPQKR